MNDVEIHLKQNPQKKGKIGKFFLVITGKGPMKAFYENKI